jgi:hypothetical protein
MDDLASAMAVHLVTLSASRAVSMAASPVRTPDDPSHVLDATSGPQSRDVCSS